MVERHDRKLLYEEPPRESRRNTTSSSIALRKVVLVGDSGVGKTAILSRFMTGSMPSTRRATMGATEKMKSVHVPSLNKRLPLQVWDITGNEKFRTLTSIYFRDADAAIMVCDVTDKDSFENLKNVWYKEIQSLGPENMILFIVGNKTDMLTDVNGEGTEEVTQSMVKDFASWRKAEWMMTSARRNQGIDEVFQRLAEKLINHQPSVSTNSYYIFYQFNDRQEHLESAILPWAIIGSAFF